MKSLTAVCQTGAASMPPINANGRISRHPPHRDGENAEMKMYLSKLKDLVPFMPKNRKLSKLEIIQHVIDYICDLQTELETHPEITNFDAAAALSAVAGADESDDMMEEDSETTEMSAAGAAAAADILALRFAAEQEQLVKSSSPAAAATARQPLIDRQAPNTILSTNTATTTLATPAPAPVITVVAPSLATTLNADKESRQS